MGFPVAIQTLFGTLFAGRRTNHTTRGKHARVETGRNMPGTPGKCPSTFNYATSCRTYLLHSKPSKVPLFCGVRRGRPTGQEESSHLYFDSEDITPIRHGIVQYLFL